MARVSVSVLLGTLVVAGKGIGPGGTAELDADEAEGLAALGTVSILGSVAAPAAPSAPTAPQPSLLPDAGDEAGDPTEA